MVKKFQCKILKNNGFDIIKRNIKKQGKDNVIY